MSSIAVRLCARPDQGKGGPAICDKVGPATEVPAVIPDGVIWSNSAIPWTAAE